MAEEINLDGIETLQSSNFGPGIELLMNDKKKESSSNNESIDIEDLDVLEKDLNEFSEAKIDVSLPDTINLNSEPIQAPPHITFDKEPTIKIGESTADSFGSKDKTWDGYGQFNEIPMNPDVAVPSEPKLSREETLKEKVKYLRKLELLEKKGAELSKKYSMDSSLDEMKGEYELVMGEKEKENSIKFQGNMLSALINGVEFLNNKFDPFDINLDGWGEQFQENVSDYDEIFGELHEKYKSKAKMAPELKLLFQLGASGMMIHMSNTMFKSSLPGMDDIMRQNPDLMNQFNQAALNSMGKTNPGFTGFVNNMMNKEPSVVDTGPPPEPINTQGPGSMAPPNRPGYRESNTFNSRPDLYASRGVDITDNFGNPDQPQKSRRREMKGPENIDSILSGLKEKEKMPENIVVSKQQDDDNLSVVSITELKEMKENATGPKRRGRKPRSERNTVSLDI
jgi:hypothetical protein